MKKERIIGMMIVLIFLCQYVCGCAKAEAIWEEFSKKATPQDTLEKLEEAMNKGDAEQLLDCYCSSFRKVLSGGGGLIGSLIGLDIDAAAELLAGLWGMSGESLGGYEVQLDVLDVAYQDEENCLVTVNMTLTDENGDAQTEEMEMPMVLEKREWKIKVTLEDLGL